MKELAREWKIYLGGRWHRGMIDGHTGHLCTGTYADGTGSFWLGDERSEPVHLVHENSRYPDLNHPGTVGFLIQDLCKAWGAGHEIEIDWHCLTGKVNGVIVWHRTSDCAAFRSTGCIGVEALVAALRAAPEKT